MPEQYPNSTPSRPITMNRINSQIETLHGLVGDIISKSGELCGHTSIAEKPPIPAPVANGELEKIADNLYSLEQKLKTVFDNLLRAL